jgi:hypothetical protein
VPSAPLAASPDTTGRKPARAATITTLTPLLALWAAALCAFCPLAITAPRAPANLTGSPRPAGQHAARPADTWT